MRKQVVLLLSNLFLISMPLVAVAESHNEEIEIRKASAIQLKSGKGMLDMAMPQINPPIPSNQGVCGVGNADSIKITEHPRNLDAAIEMITPYASELFKLQIQHEKRDRPFVIFAAEYEGTFWFTHSLSEPPEPSWIGGIAVSKNSRNPICWSVW